MMFDPENAIVKHCALGMALEGEGKHGEAFELFWLAWNEAQTDLEKFTSAHYVARHQRSVAGKLTWDQIALRYALRAKDKGVESIFPSLYLNIARDYEEMSDTANALKHYELASSYQDRLSADGYGNLIRTGINNGLARMSGVTGCMQTGVFRGKILF